jgi:hypothetical protein
MVTESQPILLDIGCVDDTITGMEWISVSEAADRLGVSPARVRVLIRRGDLLAEQVAGRWLVDVSSVDRSAARLRRAGRPFDPRAAWGLLAIADDRSPEWLAPPERARLRKVLASRGVFDLAAQLGRRAVVEHWHVHPSLLDLIAAEDEVVIAGPRASDELAGDRSALEVYVRPDAVDHLRRAYQPASNARNANLLVRIVEGPWPFARQDRRAWPAVVAIDLLDQHPDDPRCREVAVRMLADRA